MEVANFESEENEKKNLSISILQKARKTGDSIHKLWILDKADKKGLVQGQN